VNWGQIPLQFRRSPETVAFTVPYPTPPPFPKTCSQPWVGLEIREYLRAFQICLADATPGFEAKMGSLAPVLSKAGDLGDFSARYKLLNFIGKNLPDALRVEYSDGGGWGTLGGMSQAVAKKPLRCSRIVGESGEQGPKGKILGVGASQSTSRDHQGYPEGYLRRIIRVPPTFCGGCLHLPSCDRRIGRGGACLQYRAGGASRC
jgi:hypothetical protein